MLIMGTAVAPRHPVYESSYRQKLADVVFFKNNLQIIAQFAARFYFAKLSIELIEQS